MTRAAAAFACDIRVDSSVYVDAFAENKRVLMNMCDSLLLYVHKVCT